MIPTATMKRLCLSLALAGVPVAAASVSVAADAPRCARLMAYYDRYVQWINEETPLGYMQREIGEQECKLGRYQSGIAELEMAIRLIGFTPPRD